MAEPNEAAWMNRNQVQRNSGMACNCKIEKQRQRKSRIQDVHLARRSQKPDLAQ